MHVAYADVSIYTCVSLCNYTAKTLVGGGVSVPLYWISLDFFVYLNNNGDWSERIMSELELINVEQHVVKEL